MWVQGFVMLVLLNNFTYSEKFDNFKEHIDDQNREIENKIFLKTNETIKINNPSFGPFGRQASNLRLTIISPLSNRCSMRVTCKPISRSQRGSTNCDEYLEVIQKHDGSIKKICDSRTVFLKGDVSVRFRQGRQNTLASILGAGLRSCSFSCPTTVRVNNKAPPVPNVKAEPHPCKCGNNGLKKVVNGIEANMGEFPWQVAIVSRGRTRPYCGGSIINSKYVLTAAHCVTRPGLTPSRIQVVVNEHNTLTTSERNSTRLKVDLIIAHPEYRVTENSESLRERHAKLFFPSTSPFAVNDNDVALLKLADEIDLTALPPICLPRGQESSMDFSGYDATISGWGLTSESSTDPSPVLKKTQLKVLSNGNCGRNYIIPGLINQRMVCASGFQTGSCFGDSGGPLSVKRSRNEFMQIGIVSWGIGCARSFPTVYTRVTEFLPWIYENSADGGFCSN